MFKLRSYRMAALCVASLLLAITADASASSEAILWIQENAIPLATVNASEDLTDLECLRATGTE